MLRKILFVEISELNENNKQKQKKKIFTHNLQLDCLPIQLHSSYFLTRKKKKPKFSIQIIHKTNTYTINKYI